MAGRQRLLLLAPIPETAPVAFRYRSSPIDAASSARLLAAAAAVSSHRTRRGTGYVYVALLEGARRGHPFSLYVGSTVLGPMERYRQHLAGIKAGKRWIQKYGRGLLPKLYARLNPMPAGVREDVELALAGALREAGFDVIGPAFRRGPRS